jgi:acetyl esterase/lipase
MFRDDRMDPETKAPIEAWRGAMGGGINLDDIPACRALMDKLIAQVPKPPPVEGIKIEDRKAPGPKGGPEVMVRLYRPSGGNLPGLLWIHGGGYVLGNVERDDATCANLAKFANCVIASVEYRLAPEHPFPAPLEDCYAALKWFAGASGELGIDRSRIAISGASAGGGLAAGLALAARDRKEVKVKAQFLIYPMIDDRNVQPASSALYDTHVWTRENNRVGWKSYLGRDPGGKDVSPYAAASRASDLAGLPPAYISVGDIDLFLEENIDYAQRLLAAGVPTELHVYPGGCHGFNGMAPNAAISKRFNADRDEAVKRLFGA